MNEPFNGDREDLTHAEYVLGVLDADARAALERAIARNPRDAAEVARWQKHLLPLAGDIAPVAPPDYVWARIQSALGFPGVQARAPVQPHRQSLWQSVALWRWFALGAGAAAVACIALLVALPRAPSAPPATQVAYVTARIQQDNGLPGWTATLDTMHARVVLVPAAPNPIPNGRVPELWLIPHGGKPIALGVFAPDQATTLKLPRDVSGKLDAQALLAVSIEPPGGSPTGQPTGPIVGKGELHI
ncbi:MAG TPA: anti-sigma factor [Rhodanobacteraceae bacterium]|nr:anti-sigma factor [Rhodanobacteraceae bacterium]